MGDALEAWSFKVWSLNLLISGHSSFIFRKKLSTTVKKGLLPKGSLQNYLWKQKINIKHFCIKDNNYIDLAGLKAKLPLINL